MKWELLIQQNRILTRENWTIMWSDVVKTDAANPKSEFYGYGWFKTTYKDRELVYHGGSLPGFRTVFCRFPADGTAIVILTNSNQANPKIIADGVADILYAGDKK
jgi:CubicO group peptidase (beta-lactamase class C family)